MEINGPLIISIQDDDTSLKRELHLAFKPEFAQLTTPQRLNALEVYMQQLHSASQGLHKDDPDRLGMETVRQICEALREHIRADEVDLDEIIVIEIQPTINLSGIVTSQSSIN